MTPRSPTARPRCTATSSPRSAPARSSRSTPRPISRARAADRRRPRAAGPHPAPGARSRDRRRRPGADGRALSAARPSCSPLLERALRRRPPAGADRDRPRPRPLRAARRAPRPRRARRRLCERAGVEVLIRPLSVLRRQLLNPRGLASLGAARWRATRPRCAALIRRRRIGLVHSNTSVVLGGRRGGRAGAGPACLARARDLLAVRPPPGRRTAGCC